MDRSLGVCKLVALGIEARIGERGFPTWPVTAQPERKRRQSEPERLTAGKAWIYENILDEGAKQLDVNISVDKLSIVSTPDMGFDPFLTAWDARVVTRVRRGSIDSPVVQSFHLLSGGVLQILGREYQTTGKDAVRVEFNPNNLTNDEAEFFRLLRLVVKGARVTRVDIAVDYIGENLSDARIWPVGRLVKQGYYYGSDGRLETHTMGAGGSDKYFRYYDKAREQGVAGQEWWRFESQTRRPDLQDNPFENVRLIRPPDLSEVPWKDKAVLHYLMDQPHRLGEIPCRKTKRIYKDRIAAIGESMVSPQPHQMYEQEKANLRQQVSQYTRVTAVN